MKISIFIPILDTYHDASYVDGIFQNALISIEMNEDIYAKKDVCLIKRDTDT